MDKGYREHNPLIEYMFKTTTPWTGRKIRIFKDGNVEVVGIGLDTKTRKHQNGKIIKRYKILPEKIYTFVEKILNSEFIELRDFYHEHISNGLEERVTLNYAGRFKKVKLRNCRPSRDLNSIIEKFSKFEKVPEHVPEGIEEKETKERKKGLKLLIDYKIIEN